MHSGFQDVEEIVAGRTRYDIDPYCLYDEGKPDHASNGGKEDVGEKRYERRWWFVEKMKKERCVRVSD